MVIPWVWRLIRCRRPSTSRSGRSRSSSRRWLAQLLLHSVFPPQWYASTLYIPHCLYNCWLNVHVYSLIAWFIVFPLYYQYTNLTCQYTCPVILVSSQPQTVFLNEDYVIPQPLPIDDMSPTAGVVQSDCSAVSHDVSPTGQPQEQGVQESPLKTITMETLYVCSSGHFVLRPLLLCIDHAVQ